MGPGREPVWLSPGPVVGRRCSAVAQPGEDDVVVSGSLLRLTPGAPLESRLLGEFSEEGSSGSWLAFHGSAAELTVLKMLFGVAFKGVCDPHPVARAAGSSSYIVIVILFIYTVALPSHTGWLREATSPVPAFA